MIDKLFSFIAPHHCLKCGDTGPVLCTCCQNYILDEPYRKCIFCGMPTTNDNLCQHHNLPYQRAWCLAARQDEIKQLIDIYKFKGVKSGHRDLGGMLADSLPHLPQDTVVVPVPTAPKNIRIRGYDHMLLVARQFAVLRDLDMVPVLARQSNATQHFAKSAAERRKQAGGFFKAKTITDPNRPHLIIDDIFTTGSTVEAAANKLQESGVKEVWVAVIARQADN